MLCHQLFEHFTAIDAGFEKKISIYQIFSMYRIDGYGIVKIGYDIANVTPVANVTPASKCNPTPPFPPGLFKLE
jgi:hypothetical protein